MLFQHYLLYILFCLSDLCDVYGGEYSLIKLISTIHGYAGRRCQRAFLCVSIVQDSISSCLERTLLLSLFCLKQHCVALGVLGSFIGDCWQPGTVLCIESLILAGTQTHVKYCLGVIRVNEIHSVCCCFEKKNISEYVNSLS